ncbi:MAG: uncharacterized protein QOC70_1285 [Verrucomicrobiota bacterium]|jgi:uncharacterized protein YqgC (DUF456 family)
MELLWWLIAIVLMAIGLIGTLLPVVPGAIIILVAAVLHQIMLGSEKSLGWWNIGALALLTLLSYAFEFAGGYFGAKRFGATKWGAFGATIGAIAGLFFPFPGLIVGPIVGAIAGELVAGKRLVSAGRAGWGTLLGNLAGVLGKLTIALVMVSWFLVTAPAPI